MLTETILNFFVNNAYAAESAGAAAPQPGGGFLSIMPMLIIFVIFMYFAMWRPQSKRAKEHRDLLGALAKGDEVVTAGGIVGKVAKITDSYVVIAITDTVEMTLQKSSITTVLPKGTMKTVV